MKILLNNNFLLSMVFILNLATISLSQHNDDFSYRPYPVILVHGFRSAPGESWGLHKYKSKKNVRIRIHRIEG